MNFSEKSFWSVYSGHIPEINKALPFNQLISKRKGSSVHRTNYPPHGLKGDKMGYIKEKKLKSGKRFYAEVQLKGCPRLTATFNRKSDADLWIKKTESELRCGRNQLIAQSGKHTFKEAIHRYFKEQTVSVVKRGHLQWWEKELGHHFLKDIRPSLITEKKQKLLTEPTPKGVIRTGSTCNRYLATLSHLMSICEKQWEWIDSNPVKKIAREKESRERTRFLSPEERQRLLKACQESDNPYLFTFMVLQLSTGARYNEIRNLRWTDIDLHKGRIIHALLESTLLQNHRRFQLVFPL